MNILSELRYGLHITVHPFKGFYELKHEKRGSVKSATIIVALLILTFIVQRQLTAYIFNPNNTKLLNIWTEFLRVLLPLVLWCVANWCLTTLMDGEGSFRDIYIATCFALIPMIILYIPLIPISYLLVNEEASFYNFGMNLAIYWSAALIVLGTMVTHQYTMKKTILTILLIIVGMALIIFIALLFFSVIQQMYGFVYVIYKELMYRL